MTEQEFRDKYPAIKLLVGRYETRWFADARDASGRFIAAFVRPTVEAALNELDHACQQGRTAAHVETPRGYNPDKIDPDINSARRFVNYGRVEDIGTQEDGASEFDHNEDE